MSGTLVEEIVYPSSDGKPMADNTRQFDDILMLAENLRFLYRDHSDVAVLGNLLWYPKQGDPKIVAAPDVMVVFGRSLHFRPSYKQWEEDHIPPTVVFEIRSESNTDVEMWNKLHFYEEYGVKEYFILDPREEPETIAHYLHGGSALVRQLPLTGPFRSRFLNGLVFAIEEDRIVIRDGKGNRMEAGWHERVKSEQRATQAELAARQAKLERDLARLDAANAKLALDQEKRDRENDRRRADKLAEMLRALGIEPPADS